MQGRKLFLFEIGTDEVDEIFREFGSDLLFCAIHKVEADVGFEDLGHEAVYATTDGCEEHELISAVSVGVNETLDGFELTAEAASSLKELYFFAFLQGHEPSSCSVYQ